MQIVFQIYKQFSPSHYGFPQGLLLPPLLLLLLLSHLRWLLIGDVAVEVSMEIDEAVLIVVDVPSVHIVAG